MKFEIDLNGIRVTIEAPTLTKRIVERALACVDTVVNTALDYDVSPRIRQLLESLDAPLKEDNQ